MLLSSSFDPESGLLSDATLSKRPSSTSSDTADICIATAEKLQKNEHFKEAIQLYAKARRHAPDRSGLTHQIAILYDRIGQTVQARKEFQHAITQEPSDAGIAADYGYFLMQHGEFQPAVEALESSLEKAPHNEQARNNYAVLLMKMGRYEESLAQFMQVVGQAAAHSNVGVLHAKAGRNDLARKHLTQARELDPSLQHPQAFLNVLDGS